MSLVIPSPLSPGPKMPPRHRADVAMAHLIPLQQALQPIGPPPLVHVVQVL